MSSGHYEVVVIGGGIYGCVVATHLKRVGVPRVLLLEREHALLQRASRLNQLRVHQGYHYPRSYLTGMRSRVNYDRFVTEYRECLRDDCDHYYAISTRRSSVSARQFVLFCEHIGAPIEAAPEEVRKLFDPDLVEDVFLVRECTFEPDSLARRLAADLAAAGVEVVLGAEVRRVTPHGGRALQLTWTGKGCAATTADFVIQCTYSRLNKLLTESSLPRVPLKHELAELALIEIPKALEGRGFTVMCGPFFSLLPAAERGLYSLSHVLYTPHGAWLETGEGRYRDPDTQLVPRAVESHFPHMIQDARRYLPALSGARRKGSLWEVKAVLPQSEVDDSRPILIHSPPGLPNLINVMGSKIDNVYDVLDEIQEAVA